MERVIGLDTTRDASSCKNLISGGGDLIIFFFHLGRSRMRMVSRIESERDRIGMYLPLFAPCL